MRYKYLSYFPQVSLDIKSMILMDCWCFLITAMILNINIGQYSTYMCCGAGDLAESQINI